MQESRQFFPFRPIGIRSSLHITYRQVIDAMGKASKGGNCLAAGRKYAVMNPRTGETFSPKDLLRLIVGSGRVFHGGKGVKGANRVFQAFGFPVGNVRDLRKKQEKLAKRKRYVLSTETLLRRLFSQRWRLLPSKSELRGIEHGSYPGVYLLAYSPRNLERQKVQERDVFYVGMTCEGGLSTRLGQFRQGITTGGFHSGAERFYKVWLRRKPYDPNGACRLYFTCFPIECETSKQWRSPGDIAMLSRVPELELAAIARVKRRIHHEPLLNKK